ncbi:hypothetical protein JAAARDRAFT_27630 [Jaapia argillacea MUCL 33604]|uniref:Phytase A n=1 Tax=Jaapia argillacea MUCL 33604 TaxID=933084 RepID=A0A067QA90_9AGAM|nr:hypothetical protein JAAARDRAFT_27630 [Jaapia argillacea MUCL 33604]
MGSSSKLPLYLPYNDAGRQHRNRSSITIALLAFFAASALYLAWPAWTSPGLSISRGEINSFGAGSGRIQRRWAQYSPWYAVAEYQRPPQGCTINQVNILQRHGARYPTSGAGKDIQSALQKLKSARLPPRTRQGSSNKLHFLKHFVYDLGEADLVPYGASESYEAGRTTFRRYGHLVDEENLPFVRASGSERVILSATNWTKGFSFASQSAYFPVLSVILDESLNDTLDDSMCPSATSPSPYTSIWLSQFAPPITSRLNAAAPGANLTDEDTHNLMSLCPFDSVAHVGQGRKEARKVCKLFSEEEWEAYEYFGDLNKFYGTGYGQPLGPIQGVGYINELLARLTNKPVHDHTQTNTTLDSSPLTFPLNKTLYADFSHDNQMIAIYSAIGLFNQSHLGFGGILDPRRPDERRTWRVSEMVPFAARMVVERLSCGEGGEEYVRILVNEKVQPLEFCGGSGGMCALEDFVESQVYARSSGGGDFEKCFEK